MLRSHLDMIGRNEPIQRKAKFWQSYVRALKGTDDMKAPESSRRPQGIFRPLLSSEYPEIFSSTWPTGKSIYDDPIHPHERINCPGYRYNPVSRETYGISPRNIYPHHYSSTDRYRPAPTQEHLFEQGLQSVLKRLKQDKSKVYVITKPFASLQTLELI